LWIFALCFLLLLLPPLASSESDKGIDPRDINKLNQELINAQNTESTTSQRRELKNIVRRACSLADLYPRASNRYSVLGIAFQAQKDLMVIDNSRIHQIELLNLGKRLLDAPDQYASLRMESEYLLQHVELDSKGASEQEKAIGIAQLADRYRNTSVELESLILCTEEAFRLGQAELLGAIRHTLKNKFSDRVKAIGFLNDRFSEKSSSLLFGGSFQDENGETLSLPLDRIGHILLSCFWSINTPHLKDRLLSIKKLQEAYPDCFEVLSFNLDELQDAGKSTLGLLGLDWRALHLPDGYHNPLFRAITDDPLFSIRIVNSNGYIVLTPIGSTYRSHGRNTDLEEYLKINLEPKPYLSLVQSIRIGDFLIVDPSQPFAGNTAPELAGSGLKRDKKANDLPEHILQEIQNCFHAPPLRYYLSKEQTFNNYQKASRLCSEAICRYAEADNLWLAYNRKIIALLGMWNQSGQPRYIKEAVKTAQEVLSTHLPREAEIVARFCLTKAALREERADPLALIQQFSENGKEATSYPLKVATLVILSLDAAKPHLYSRYREQLLDKQLENPRLWSVTSYLFDPFVNEKMFRGNHYRTEKRIYFGFREWQKNTETRPRQLQLNMNNLNGQQLVFPQPNPDTYSVILFLDLPVDPQSAEIQIAMVEELTFFTQTPLSQKLNLVLAFLSSDQAKVEAWSRKNGWDQNRVTLVPSGWQNPHVLRLGVLLAEQRPNTYVVNPEGAIIWGMSGMYHMSTGISAVNSVVKEIIQRPRQTAKKRNQALNTVSDHNHKLPSYGMNVLNYIDTVK